MTNNDRTVSRKSDHVRIVLDEDVKAKGIETGFADYRLPHEALPDLNLSEVDTSMVFLGKTLQAPLLVSSMTGGARDVAYINTALAEAVQSLGLAMGVGSQRAAVQDGSLAYTYQVRRVAPDIPLLANLGAVQLNYGYGVDECRRAVEMIEADALILHLNALQEAIQPEGDTHFKGLLQRIEEVCAKVSVPVIVKEVGNGISAQTAKRLVDAGVWGIDVAGAGGTSWSEVERFRQTNNTGVRVAAAFAGWGIPTTKAICQIRAVLPDTCVIGSGGVRSGVDVAKAIALGADLAATAKPALGNAVQERGVEAVIEGLQAYLAELRIAMFCSGCGNLQTLRQLQLLCA
ncbi:MAG: type 2 isopentenyl-diphosphate Delta-isomerase [Chloroflexi bacterium AL-W]|nr:type 2 isopentenyl-diphosphate Delta-isomerase [Chloroflexi bacterium AL-N1]NOK65089.1 type 2 isopentenyl-diphosphate Delta-isomerase [Chloroflexi bacterium AL-N10]NOK72644.1 type 2 isopentenyl-diphosphate Delta-isomerase [Chloroflexi bacterium AL-N5]NOK79268.1 type 2 isopentenyl-diphosphate Delta-isomerase [Chloroflexi bacterium AL-W]NOK87184.1 type 2 isopentenyl-diphosphate Delta-isomerase [Chloroflexi bacterium AL-N15]